MKRFLAAALLLPLFAGLAACDLRPSDNPPNEATALLRDTRTGKEEFCQADFWSPDTTRVDTCIREHQARGFALVQKNY